MSITTLTWSQRILISLLRAYRFFLSPWLGNACRFEPTCSAYSLQAIQRHGAAAGTYMTFRRLVRCQPWCEGGHDPVPAMSPALFRSFSAGVPVHPDAASSPSTDKISP